MTRRFSGEPIQPIGEAFDVAAMAHGEPGLPRAFRWTGGELHIVAVQTTRRGLKVDRGDVYLKRHWYEVQCDDGSRATIYFDRGARPGKPRWWLYAIDEGSER